jgi:hypothetical protein
MNKNNENKADAKFKGGMMGAMLGGAIGGGGHWAVEKFMPSFAAGKMNKNTMVATALTTAALGAYVGAVEMWETYLPRGKAFLRPCAVGEGKVSNVLLRRWYQRNQEVKHPTCSTDEGRIDRIDGRGCWILF